jgi:hypothetical protein
MVVMNLSLERYWYLIFVSNEAKYLHVMYIENMKGVIFHKAGVNISTTAADPYVSATTAYIYTYK